ncbi:Na/Pi cotransporter family protein [Lujinxingia vulgaris]|uniref:Na/Pi cotransporter family protein n=1 Tax=Lujinxingia vulgaris TaxID=2600176 RepID=A0A5C6XEV2_9DELT|nr:Na/Pi symporter [Lujinxingia vulgaris]TXD35652.1 Na/Pi cotransporter family protein [Lujinxingia vulgaris]
MHTLITNILGGVGLFLLGMALLSDGLRSLGGNALRAWLQRLTGNRLSSVATGTVVTALVQSSSATTLMTIGFVSAGLLSFTQSLGVILGANLGTTMTSWLVALIGLKIDIGAFALPLVGIGAFIHLLARARGAKLGTALAGFGLIFVGIDVLQTGMLEVSTRVSPADFAIDGFGGRLLLVGVGIVMTVIMQSSSAAVAATLTALATGAIDVTQAASLVIGQNVGTTITAAIGSIGATIPARRTALAHILFNVLTGCIALAALPLLIPSLNALLTALHVHDDATHIAAFHTAFNLIGVLLLLPFIHPFSALIERLIPGPVRRFTSHLDTSTHSLPPIALDAAATTISEMLSALHRATLASLDEHSDRNAHPDFEPLASELREGIAQTRAFLNGVQTSASDERLFARHLSLLHALDHLERYLRWTTEHGNLQHARINPNFSNARKLLINLLHCALDSPDPHDTTSVAQLAELSALLGAERERLRPTLIRKNAAHASVDLFAEQRSLNALTRIAYHTWRARHHLTLPGDSNADVLDAMN